MTCRWCKGSGWVQLLTSRVECECRSTPKKHHGPFKLTSNHLSYEAGYRLTVQVEEPFRQLRLNILETISPMIWGERKSLGPPQLQYWTVYPYNVYELEASTAGGNRKSLLFLVLHDEPWPIRLDATRKDLDRWWNERAHRLGIAP